MSYRSLCLSPVLSLLLLLAATTGLLGVPDAARAADFTRDLAIEADEFVLANLIGEVRLEPATGDRFEVRIEVQGKDADPDLIKIEIKEGRQARVEVVFPLDTHRDYVFPRLGRGSRTTIREPGTHDDGGWVRRLLEGFAGMGITVRGSGRGLEVWADVTIMVPRARQTEVQLGAGKIEAAKVDGDLTVAVRSGPVTVKDHRGNVSVDTGSGSVKIEGVEGDLHIDTGSGGVSVADHRGPSLHVDTGSGGVVVDRADTESLRIDTGSGGVKARAIKTDRATIDTGSGSVVLELDGMGEGSFVIDTGSGGVRLALPHDASATIEARTGSGGIRADIEGAEVTRDGRNRMQMRVGDGKATVRIKTGSGGVAITGR